MNRRQWREFARGLLGALAATHRRNLPGPIPSLPDLTALADARDAAEARLRRSKTRWP